MQIEYKDGKVTMDQNTAKEAKWFIKGARTGFRKGGFTEEVTKFWIGIELKNNFKCKFDDFVEPPIFYDAVKSKIDELKV